MFKLLVIDDNADVHVLLASVVLAEGVSIRSAYSAREGIDSFKDVQPDVVLLDVGLPDESGLNVFRAIHALDARVPVIFLTGGSTTDVAIEAMSLGAYEYLLKPFNPLALRRLLIAANEVSRLARVAPRLVEDAKQVACDADLLLGRCPAMHEVYKAIGRVSKQDTTVLITGESGTGKELVARSIYHYSLRSAGPFLAINCAAIPETLLESELFGHEQGAFTGATQRRIGKFEQCNNGTLFLDEVGDMSPLTQAKILRVLQDQQFERVGGNQTIHTNVRILAATNCNLHELVEKKVFREDLYYRLNAYSIALPALRERGGDLLVLIEYFKSRYAAEMNKHVTSFAQATLEKLQRYPWPGNIRELQSVIKFALIEATSPVIVPEFLPKALRESAQIIMDEPTCNGEHALAERVLSETPVNAYQEWTKRTDMVLLDCVLKRTRGNVLQAAKILGMHRGTLRAKAQALNLSLESYRAMDTPLAVECAYVSPPP